MQSEGAGNQIALQKKKDKMSGLNPDTRDKEGGVCRGLSQGV